MLLCFVKLPKLLRVTEGKTQELAWMGNWAFER